MSQPDAKTVLNRWLTEDELLTAITEAATYRGWRWHHVRRSDKALQMGHSGFPDLVLARKGQVLFLELKAEQGRISPDQQAWMNQLWSGAQVRALVVVPSMLDRVLGWLE